MSGIEPRSFADHAPPRDGRHILLLPKDLDQVGAEISLVCGAWAVGLWSPESHGSEGWFLCTDPSDLSECSGAYPDEDFAGWLPLPDGVIGFDGAAA